MLGDVRIYAPTEHLVIGEPAGIRTRDPLIKSQVLYRLSYGLVTKLIPAV
jgi:hypothetical protein